MNPRPYHSFFLSQWFDESVRLRQRSGDGDVEAWVKASRNAPAEADKILSHWVESKVAATGNNLMPKQQGYYRERPESFS
ncbi:MAG: hypothetical protein D4R76_05425 [Methylococcus sp.]|nr:MAG: hypothetical protein D4R76_05425 [Methylococcus sp.]